MSPPLELLTGGTGSTPSGSPVNWNAQTNAGTNAGGTNANKQIDAPVVIIRTVIERPKRPMTVDRVVQTEQSYQEELSRYIKAAEGAVSL
jgi:hypothetical protein